MAISYKPLFRTMLDKNKKVTDLNAVVSTNVSSKFRKNQHVNTGTLDKLCRYLDCRIEDIIEYVTDQAQA